MILQIRLQTLVLKSHVHKMCQFRFIKKEVSISFQLLLKRETLGQLLQGIYDKLLSLISQQYKNQKSVLLMICVS